MSSANITDISDKGWDDLSEADRDVLQELAKERDGIDARGASEALAAALLAYHGRHDEVPEDVGDEYADEIQSAIEAGLQTGTEAEDDDGLDTQVAEDDDDEAVEEEVEAPTEDDREPEEEAEDDDEERNHRLDNVGDPSTPPTADASFIIEAGIFHDWWGHVDTLVDEAKVHLNEDGLTVRAVDPANVAMIDTDLTARAFESFDVGDVGVIGVNVERVEDVVKAADAGDLLHLEYDHERRNLVVSHGGHTFRLALIVPDSIRKEPDVPDLDLPAEAAFAEARTLYDAIGFADSVSDHVSFAAGTSEQGVREFVVGAEGDTDTYEGAFVADDELTFTRFGEARSLFSLDYLKDIRKAWAKGVGLTVEIGNEFPCTVTQAVVSDDHEVGEAAYLLAPRIQSD